MEKLLSSVRKFGLVELIPFLLAGAFFSLPISSSAKSLFLSLALVSILATPIYRRKLISLFAQPWCKAALLLFFLALIACLWSPATVAEKYLVIEKYSKLLYLPILTLGFQDAKARLWSLNAYLIAIVLTCSISVLKFHGYLTTFVINPDYVFRNHIMTGIMVAFGVYLSIIFLYRYRGKLGFLYGMVALFLSYQLLFVNSGRTGYIIYFLLMLVLIFQLFSWKRALISMGLVIASFVVIYSLNPLMQSGMSLIIKEYQAYQQNEKNTSLGYRLQFHEFAKKLFFTHPFIGNGTGAFTYKFSADNPVPTWDRKLLEPHSQYWLTAAEFGLVGIAALLFFFLSLLQASLALREMKAFAIAILVAFLVGNLSDSLFFYSGSGYFFILLMALCLSENREQLS